VNIGEPEREYLPPGIYPCTLGEVKTAFAYNPKRKGLLNDLEKYIKYWNKYTNINIVYLDGSFVSSKEKPGDADVIILIPDVDLKKPDILRMLNTYTGGNKESEYFGCHGFGVPEGLESLSVILNDFTHSRPGEFEKGILRVEL
jgi:hypothetical protein